jgi:hypothetical protein
VITKWHPVLLNGKWQHPANLPYVETATALKVRTFVLDGGGSVVVNGVPAVTLGHGFADDVAAHDFYGTGRVLEDLKKFPGWDDGFVTVTGADKLLRPAGPDGDMVVTAFRPSAGGAARRN